MLGLMRSWTRLLTKRTPDSFGPQGHLWALPEKKSGCMSPRSTSSTPNDCAPSTSDSAPCSRASAHSSRAGKTSPTDRGDVGQRRPPLVARVICSRNAST